MMVGVENLRVRDPFIFVENGTYYLLGTTGNDCWGKGSDFMLYVSSDLKSFEPVGNMVADNALSGYTQLWAPELHRYGDKYYLIVSVFSEEKGRGCMILVADSLKGPFTPLTGDYITPRGWRCLDATLFVRKGRPYLCFSNEWVEPVTGDGDGSLYVAELSSGLARLTSAPKKIISGKYCGFSKEISDAEARGFVAEGPFAVSEGDKIALYWSTFTERGYCVAKSVSDEATGDYVFDRMIFDSDGGHCMIFTDLYGDRKLALHQPNDSPRERLKVVDLDG